jgi:predicted Zn-dependent peptidase
MLLRDYKNKNFTIKEQKTVKYENGLTSILINNKNNLVASVIVFVMVGSVNENSYQTGLSHFLEHLMFKVIKNYIGDMMTRKIENMGGYINAATTKEFTMYYINIQKDGLEESIRMLADSIQNPLFMQSEIDVEKKVVIEEIQRHFDNPISVLYEKFYETIYTKSALRNSIIGTSHIITNISYKEVYNYYRSHYIPEKMVVVVSGNFDEFSVKKLIYETFGKFKKQTKPIDPLLIEEACIGKDVVEYGEVELGYMITGFLGPSVNEEDIYVADLAVNILGGGKTSRLYRVIYEQKHLVYTIESFFVTGKGTGNIYIISTFDPKNLEDIKIEIKKQIENIISEGITEEELNRVKLLIKTDWNFSLETSFDVANMYGYWYLMGNPEFITEYIKRVENLKCINIDKFFKKYYSHKMVSNVILLPKHSKK